jgi:hypothetical protein
VWIEACEHGGVPEVERICGGAFDTWSAIKDGA